jgi:hypothetical protein
MLTFSFNLFGQGGNDCGNAPFTQPIHGIEVDHQGTNDQWYQFNTANGGQFEVVQMGQAMASAEVFVGADCITATSAGIDNDGSDGIYISFNTQQNDNIYIVFYPGPTQPYQFDFIELGGGSGGGTTCGNAAPVNLLPGTNTVDHGPTQTDEQWYHFNPMKDGEFTIDIPAAMNEVIVDVYTGSCATPILEYSDDGTDGKISITGNLMSGEMISILFHDNINLINQYQFDFIWMPSGATGGLTCADAVEVMLMPDFNTVDHGSTGNDDQWYHFYAMEDGDINVHIDNTNPEVSAELISGSCGTPNTLVTDDGTDGKIDMNATVTSGEDVYVVFYSSINLTNPYDFDFYFFPSSSGGGDICNNAQDIGPGYYQVNHSGDIDQWFSYAPTNDGMIEIVQIGEQIGRAHV